MTLVARTVNLIDYLPQVYADKKEIQELSKVENPFINRLWQNVADIYNNAFILTAEDYGLSRRERYLKINVPEESTLEDRRFNLIARYQEQAPYTKNTLTRILDTLLGAGNYTQLYDPVLNFITFRIALTSSNMVTVVNDLIERILPMNMGFLVELRYNTHSQLSAFTHAQLSTRTHSQLREGDL